MAQGWIEAKYSGAPRVLQYRTKTEVAPLLQISRRILTKYCGWARAFIPDYMMFCTNAGRVSNGLPLNDYQVWVMSAITAQAKVANRDATTKQWIVENKDKLAIKNYELLY